MSGDTRNSDLTTTGRSGSDADVLLSKEDEVLQVVTIGDNTTVISVLDDLDLTNDSVIGGSFGRKTLHLFAESALIGNKFQFKDGTFAVHALTTVGKATLDVSGSPGATDPTLNQNKQPGTVGGNGDPGGDLNVYLEAADIGPPTFNVDASGGVGGDGQQGTSQCPGASGGDGGPGGKVVVLVGLPSLQWLSLLKQANALTTVGAKSQAVKELREKIPTNIDSLRSVISLLQDIETVADRITKDVAAAKPEDRDALRKQGIAVELDPAMEKAARAIAVISTEYPSVLKSQVDVSGGNYGTHGDGNPPGEKNGVCGVDGSFSSRIFAQPVDLLADTQRPTFIFVHPSQCERLLYKIKIAYWALDPVNHPTGVKDLMISLMRLKARTDPFVDLDPDSDLAKLYSENEAAIGALGSLTQLKNINIEVTDYIRQLKLGRDFFGYESQHVPQGSFSFYQDLLNQLVANFESIETAYKTYFAELTENKDLTEHITQARQGQKRIVANAHSQISSLKTLAAKTADVIDGFQSVLSPLKQTLEAKLKEFQDEINEHFDFNFDTVFQSLTSLAFAPESAMMVLTQAGQFLYNGITKVTDDRGMPVNKDYMVSQVKAVTSDIKSIQEGYQALDNGGLAPDDPRAGKLIVEERQFEKAFADFSSQFPTQLKAVRQAFQDYITQIIKRNSQIVRYNAIITLMFKNLNTIEAAEAAEQTITDKAIRSYKPDLPAMATFMSGVYYSARSQVLEILDLTARSYRFWALSDTNPMDDILKGTAPPSINHALLVEAKNAILGAYQQAIENFGTGATNFHSPNGGITIEVPQDQVQSLISCNQMMFSLEPVDSATSKADSPFSDMADVRIDEIRIWVTGAKTSDNQLSVRIVHTGSETIVSAVSDRYVFKHEPVTKPFKYDLKKAETDREGSISEHAKFGIVQTNKENTGGDSAYAALGPFTTWNIQIRADYNLNLDLSGVTKVELEFWGTFYPFNR